MPFSWQAWLLNRKGCSREHNCWYLHVDYSCEHPQIITVITTVNSPNFVGATWDLQILRLFFASPCLTHAPLLIIILHLYTGLSAFRNVCLTCLKYMFIWPAYYFFMFLSCVSLASTASVAQLTHNDQVSCVLTVNCCLLTTTFPCSTSSLWYMCVCLECVFEYVNMNLVSIILECMLGKYSKRTSMENCFREWLIISLLEVSPGSLLYVFAKRPMTKYAHCVTIYCMKQSVNTTLNIFNTCLMQTQYVVTVGEFREV